MGCMCASLRDKRQETKGVAQEKPMSTDTSTQSPQSDVEKRRASTLKIVTGKIRQIPVLVEKIYCLGKKSCGGGGCQVYQSVHISTRQSCTLKIYPKPALNEVRHLRKKVAAEAKLLSKFDHPNIVKVLDVLEDENSLVIVLEALAEVSLVDAFGELSETSEELLATTFKQLLQAVKYCESLSIFLPEIVPNDVAVKQGSRFIVKLIRFAAAGVEERRGAVGKKSVYTAPEAVLGKATEKSIVWSCGAILHTMICGVAPFRLSKYLQSVERNRPLAIDFTSEKWAAVSPEVADLLHSMLAWDPRQRMSLDACLQSPWIRLHARNKKPNVKLLKSVLKHLAASGKSSALREAVRTFILSRVVTDEEQLPLIEVFSWIDTDGDGRISATELLQACSLVMPEEESRSSVQRTFSAVEKDACGCITFSTFMQCAYSDSQVLSTRNLTTAFTTLDSDGSGHISLSELKCVFLVNNSFDTEQLWQSMLKGCSKSRDSEIDFDEFVLLMHNSASCT